MVIDGYCGRCRAHFDAHFTVYPVFTLPNTCPHCKSPGVQITDDETDDNKDVYDYDE